MDSIVVKLGSLDDVINVNNTIEEFDTKFTKEHFETFLKDKTEKLIVVAYLKNKPIGFQIAFSNNNDIHLWCAAVSAKHRRKGVMTQLVNYIENVARKNKKNKIFADISNRLPGIIHFFIDNKFYVYDFVKFDDILDNKLFLVKDINAKTN